MLIDTRMISGNPNNAASSKAHNFCSNARYVVPNEHQELWPFRSLRQFPDGFEIFGTIAIQT